MRTPRSIAFTATVPLVALSMVLSGCGAGSKTAGTNVGCDIEAPSKSTTVQVLAYASPTIDPFSNAMAKGCDQVENLNMEHGQIDFGAQLEKAQLSLSQSGTGTYDIVEVYGGTLPQYAAKGWLQPLDDIVEQHGSKFNVDDIDPRLREAFTYDDKLYGLPMEVNVHVMVYRKDILESLDIEPPTTFDELAQASAKIEESGKVRYPLALSYGSSSAIGAAFNNSLTSLGGRWVNPKTNKPELTSPQAVEAVESLRQMVPYISPDAATFDQPQVLSALQNGQSAIGILYSGQAGGIDEPGKSEHAGDFGYAQVPSVKKGGGPWATLNVDGFAVAKNSAAPTELLSQIAMVGTGEDAAREAGTKVYPARTSLINDESLSSKAPVWKPVQETLDADVKTYPKQGYFVPMQTAVNPFLADAVNGSKPVKQALQQAQDAAAKTVKSYRGTK